MGEVKKLAEVLGASISAPSPICTEHDVTRFTCGKPPLDDWLRQRALKSEGASSRTYVVCIGSQVVGYYAIATGGISRGGAPKRLQRNMPNDLPVVILARLAVDTRCHGQGIGKGLLKEAIIRGIQISEIAGVRGILVHAIDDEAAAFYQRYGFQLCPISPQTYILPIDTAKQAL